MGGRPPLYKGPHPNFSRGTGNENQAYQKKKKSLESILHNFLPLVSYLTTNYLFFATSHLPLPPLFQRMRRLDAIAPFKASPVSSLMTRYDAS
jgi:hypothetical protein